MGKPAYLHVFVTRSLYITSLDFSEVLVGRYEGLLLQKVAGAPSTISLEDIMIRYINKGPMVLTNGNDTDNNTNFSANMAEGLATRCVAKMLAAAASGTLWVSAGGGTANVAAGALSRILGVSYPEAHGLLDNTPFGADWYDLLWDTACNRTNWDTTPVELYIRAAALTYGVYTPKGVRRCPPIFE